jgi:hypothetical protein
MEEDDAGLTNLLRKTIPFVGLGVMLNDYIENKNAWKNRSKGMSRLFSVTKRRLSVGRTGVGRNEVVQIQ